MHARTHARTHALMHAHTNSRTHTCTCTCTHARTHARMHARTYVRTHACMHARTHTRTHACTHARTHPHTRYTCIHSGAVNKGAGGSQYTYHSAESADRGSRVYTTARTSHLLLYRSKFALKVFTFRVRGSNPSRPVTAKDLRLLPRGTCMFTCESRPRLQAGHHKSHSFIKTRNRTSGAQRFRTEEAALKSWGCGLFIKSSTSWPFRAVFMNAL
jgi:hypothetical protein